MFWLTERAETCIRNLRSKVTVSHSISSFQMLSPVLWGKEALTALFSAKQEKYVVNEVFQLYTGESSYCLLQQKHSQKTVTAWTSLAKSAGKSPLSSKWLRSVCLPPQNQCLLDSFSKLASFFDANFLTMGTKLVHLILRQQEEMGGTIRGSHCQVRSHLSCFFLRQMKSHRKLTKSQEQSSGWLRSQQEKCSSIHLISDLIPACWKELKANSPRLIKPYANLISIS